MAATFPVQTGSAFDVNPSYSGSFIPTLWSAKLNVKFYATTVFGDITNNTWEGEIKGIGDKVVINNIPDTVVASYSAGMTLSYPVPTPSTEELIIDNGQYFAFQLNDVLAHQSSPKLMEVFTNDATMKMKIRIDSNVLYNTFQQAAAANVGATAGAQSGSYNLGTDLAPITLSGSNVVELLTSMSAVLDEQNVPEDDRFLVIDPATRQWLMSSPLAQAYVTGDSQSMLRNGKIGTIDRFTVYVSNLLPRAAAGTATPYVSGDGSQSTITSTSNLKRRIIIAGHKSAITFASQMTKMETVRNPNDFGDYVRGLNVYGYLVAKPQSLTYAVVA